MDNRQSSYQNSCRLNHSNMMERPTPTPASSCRPSRKELMEKINQYSFAVNEANLFLDTHPFDQEALDYFQKYRALRVDAIREYDKYFAPLIIDHTESDKIPWSWVSEPWPWEGVEC